MPKDRKKIAWEEAFNAAQMWNIVSILHASTLTSVVKRLVLLFGFVLSRF